MSSPEYATSARHSGRSTVKPPTAAEWEIAQHRGLGGRITGDQLREIRSQVVSGIRAAAGSPAAVIAKMQLRIDQLQATITKLKIEAMNSTT